MSRIEPGEAGEAEHLYSFPSKSPYPVKPDVLAALTGNGDSSLSLEIEGETLSFTNLNKVFWPATANRAAVTKRDLAIYMCQVAPWLIPHSTDRPITLVRFPDGIMGKRFYQQHWDKNRPLFVKAVTSYSSSRERHQQYLVCNNLATLLWLVQIADLEIHSWQSRENAWPESQSSGGKTSLMETLQSDVLGYPDYLLFDLDPYIYSGEEKTGAEPELNMRAFKQTCKLARWVKEILDGAGVESFVKTTGKTGLHMYVPLVRRHSFNEARSMCEAIGRVVTRAHEDDVTMEWSIPKRTGKIFLDYNMNARGKTLAAIYSPRVSLEGAVSMPLDWQHLDDVFPTDFTMQTVPRLLAERGDLWADILAHKNDMDTKNDLKSLIQAELEAKKAAAKRSRKKPAQ